jgi:hypothetical protein
VKRPSWWERSQWRELGRILESIEQPGQVLVGTGVVIDQKDRLAELYSAEIIERGRRWMVVMVGIGQEAVRCYEAGAYLGCAALCGASAESVLLALAMQKKTEEEVLKLYLAASGRKKIEDLIVGRAATQI